MTSHLFLKWDVKFICILHPVWRLDVSCIHVWGLFAHNSYNSQVWIQQCGGHVWFKQQCGGHCWKLEMPKSHENNNVMKIATQCLHAYISICNIHHLFKTSAIPCHFKSRLIAVFCIKQSLYWETSVAGLELAN